MTYLGLCDLALATYSLKAFISCFQQGWKGWQWVGAVGCEWGVAESLNTRLSGPTAHWCHSPGAVDICHLWRKTPLVSVGQGFSSLLLGPHNTLCLSLLEHLEQYYTIVLCPIGFLVTTILLSSNSRHIWWMNKLVPKSDLSLTWRSCFYH